MARQADRTDVWRGFQGTAWRDGIDVAAFVRDNVMPYEGDAHFLTGPTSRTLRLWAHLQRMFVEERRRGVYDVDPHTPSSITSHEPGWIDRDHELIVGLQTSAPLRRAIMPNGGLRMVENSLKAYGYPLDPDVRHIFTLYRKTHNAGVFDAYPPTSSPPAARTSSPGCPTRTAAVGSSATTAASPCTAWTG